MKALTFIAGLGIVGSFAVASPAAATPPGVEVETLSQNAVNGTEYVVTRITVAPAEVPAGTTTPARSSDSSVRGR